jgi:hypothetical protein
MKAAYLQDPDRPHFIPERSLEILVVGGLFRLSNLQQGISQTPGTAEGQVNSGHACGRTARKCRRPFASRRSLTINLYENSFCTSFLGSAFARNRALATPRSTRRPKTNKATAIRSSFLAPSFNTCFYPCIPTAGQVYSRCCVDSVTRRTACPEIGRQP